MRFESITKVYSREGLREDEVWMEYVRPAVQGLPGHVHEILDYAFNEMLNNAIEHSESTIVAFELKDLGEAMRLVILDQGVGIFRKIQRHYSLRDPRDAILELCKGKLTTDPSRHTGEGIFYTSRACTSFSIISFGLSFARVREADWLLDKDAERHFGGTDNILIHEGTAVSGTIAYDTDRQLSDVFDQHTVDQDDFGFTRTHIPVILGQYGEGLTSRSKARRIMNRVSNFKEVLLDFSGVERVTPSFADEIFRVYANAHPDVRIEYRGAEGRVEGMIQKAIRQREQEREG